MKLCVTFCRTSAGQFASYDVTPSVGPEVFIGARNKEEYDYLLSLAPRIEGMARRELEDSFLELEPVDGFGLVLKVKVGTSRSSEKKFKLRTLLGWITLFDSEHRPAVV